MAERMGGDVAEEQDGDGAEDTMFRKEMGCWGLLIAALAKDDEILGRG